MADILHVEILLLNTSLKEAQTKWIVQELPSKDFETRLDISRQLYYMERGL